VFIEIEKLKPEPLHFQHIYGLGELDLEHEDAILAQPVTADFVLTHKQQDLHVAGFVETAIRHKCSRCLKEVQTPLRARFDLFYLPQPAWKKDEEIELKYEDMVVGYYDGISLDVDLLVLEQLELTIPMKYVCREECRGLCPDCGRDLNEGPCSCKTAAPDSRLAVLLDFRSRMNK
jgi:uncharacterized protein